MIRKHALGLALLAVLASSTPGFAQDAPARFLRVATLTAAPGMTAQFEDTVRRISEAYKTTETGPQVSLTYATALGGNGSTYYIVTPFSAWGDVDGWGLIPQVLIEAYGEEEAAAILATGDASLAARETRISVTQVNFSSNSGDAPDNSPRFANVITTDVDPALTEDYFLFLAKLKEAEEAAGVTTTRRATVQGPASVFTAVRFFNNYAERENWRGAYQLLTDHLGQAEADSLIERQLRAVRSREIQVLAFRPDLSRVPQN